ncbi:MAG: ABC transporter ATP-binding protein, partial [Selenomonadaceae bacterium]|nr:ABC transporter ATP-binding protein [Selenomonadaceae bacterium]
LQRAAAQAESKKQAQLGAIQKMSEAKRTELIQRTEAEIAMAEAELKMLEHEMNDVSLQADPAKSQEIAEAYAAKEQEIQAKYEKWEQLTEA